MSGRIGALVLVCTLVGSTGGCSSGYEVAEGGVSVPDTSNSLAGNSKTVRPRRVAAVGHHYFLPTGAAESGIFENISNYECCSPMSA